MNAINKLNLSGRMAVAGIAKKLEEIYFPDDSFPLYINKKSESLKLIQQIRNEAHRFAITFHRNQRSKGTIKTQLTEVEGIGETLSIKLLKHFKSFDKIFEASLEDLSNVIGNSKAKSLWDHLHSR